ncbi:hypothetical protein N658DRAFT_227419 [Parathielavia hyrcaniae]|uniref:Uncharacterized protein n=1 Tax=Parathielavia hyrcaniae TaxID=113614 RepID=A0AAN6SYM2_9PEZI|nr:hypothetical protein N658DRAFT_227419 [Parathielavia hyrcaniae]
MEGARENLGSMPKVLGRSHHTTWTLFQAQMQARMANHACVRTPLCRWPGRVPACSPRCGCLRAFSRAERRTRRQAPQYSPIQDSMVRFASFRYLCLDYWSQPPVPPILVSVCLLCHAHATWWRACVSDDRSRGWVPDPEQARGQLQQHTKHIPKPGRMHSG